MASGYIQIPSVKFTLTLRSPTPFEIYRLGLTWKILRAYFQCDIHKLLKRHIYEMIKFQRESFQSVNSDDTYDNDHISRARTRHNI